MHTVTEGIDMRGAFPPQTSAERFCMSLMSTGQQANHMQDVLSKRVVQLEAKLQQQTLDKKDAAEEFLRERN